jgi:hypothetical protein
MLFKYQSTYRSNIYTRILTIHFQKKKKNLNLRVIEILVKSLRNFTNFLLIPQDAKKNKTIPKTMLKHFF